MHIKHVMLSKNCLVHGIIWVFLVNLYAKEKTSDYRSYVTQYLWWILEGCFSVGKQTNILMSSTNFYWLLSAIIINNLGLFIHQNITFSFNSPIWPGRLDTSIKDQTRYLFIWFLLSLASLFNSVGLKYPCWIQICIKHSAIPYLYSARSWHGC